MQPSVNALPWIGPRSPVCLAGTIHLSCIAICLVAAVAWESPLPLGAWICIESAGATLIGKAAGLPWWWTPINLLFFPAAYLLLNVELPPSAFFAAFCLLLLINAAAWSQRVPLFLSSRRAADAVGALLPRHEGFRFIDLGCGTGAMLMHLARRRPEGRYCGVELSPLPYLVCRWRVWRHRSIDAQWGDFWRIDWASYDVVYAYLSPAPMAEVWEKARREMRPGSLLISNGFCIPGVPPAQTIALGDAMKSTLYVWHM